MATFTSEDVLTKINKMEFFKIVHSNINSALGTSIHELQSRKKANFFQFLSSTLFGEIEHIDIPTRITVNGKEYKFNEFARLTFSHLMDELAAYGLVEKAKEQGKGSPVVYHVCYHHTEKGKTTYKKLK